MNRRRFLSSVSSTALLAALPVGGVMGMGEARMAFNPRLSCVLQGRTFFVVAGQEQTIHWVECGIFDEWKAAGIPILESKFLP